MLHQAKTSARLAFIRNTLAERSEREFLQTRGLLDRRLTSRPRTLVNERNTRSSTH